MRKRVNTKVFIKKKIKNSLFPFYFQFGQPKLVLISIIFSISKFELPNTTFYLLDQLNMKT